MLSDCLSDLGSMSAILLCNLGLSMESSRLVSVSGIVIVIGIFLGIRNLGILVIKLRSVYDTAIIANIARKSRRSVKLRKRGYCNFVKNTQSQLDILYS